MIDEELSEIVREKNGKHIRALRLLKGLTIEQLAEKAELSNTYLSDLERGKKDPSVTTLLKICYALDISSISQIVKESQTQVYEIMKERNEEGQ
ncbi:helix-turn-helix domain-containing protein [Evansella sp. AB-rgal1]|uniref:helix-turn-helix domain-containing protein n=1 Tax=Evansella sp. AB-rgal1 TaxID=3242696 RepID=UPI00359E9D9D